jgi:hypothetical protein
MYKNGKKMSDFGQEMAEIEHFWRSSRFFFFFLAVLPIKKSATECDLVAIRGKIRYIGVRRADFGVRRVGLHIKMGKK